MPTRVASASSCSQTCLDSEAVFSVDAPQKFSLIEAAALQRCANDAKHLQNPAKRLPDPSIQAMISDVTRVIKEAFFRLAIEEEPGTGDSRFKITRASEKEQRFFNMPSSDAHLFPVSS